MNRVRKSPEDRRFYSLAIILAYFVILSPSTGRGSSFQVKGAEKARWQMKPHAYCSTAVEMSAAPLGQKGEVEYLFECLSGPGHNSGWQIDNSFRDSGLEPETDYSYSVRVRYTKTGRSIGLPSAAISVKTRSNGRNETLGHINKIDSAFASGAIEIIPLMINGAKDNRLNIMIVNRWVKGQENAYNRPALRGEFILDARHILNVFKPGHPESLDPFIQYVQFFNVYAVWWADVPPYDANDRQNAFRWEEYDEIRDRIMLPWHSEKTGYATALNMFNGDGGGGGAANFRDKRSSHAMIVGNKISSFIHEFNHTSPRIPDEYCSGGLWGSGGEGTIITNEYRPDSIKWRAWIKPGTPIPTPYEKGYLGVVGLFEGGQHRLSSHYRSTARGCLMGAGTFAHSEETLCPPCIQQVIISSYQWLDLFDSRYPEAKELTVQTGRPLHFSIQRIHPVPDSQQVVWSLNGQTVAENVDAIDITPGVLPEYELACTVTDKSRFIRHDPPYTYLPSSTLTWIIKQPDAVDNVAPIRIKLEGKDSLFLAARDASIAADVSGGRPPYIYSWHDGAAVKNRTHLEPGRYTMSVKDADFRRAEASVAIRQIQENDPRLRSTLRGGKWRVEVRGIRNEEEIACRWSNGTEGFSVSGLDDGTYLCTITHNNGTQQVRSITLERGSALLTAEFEDVYPSSGGENNGAISLSVSGGRAPYTYIWSDGVKRHQPGRHSLKPGKYRVTVLDKNQTAVTREVTVKAESGLYLEDLIFAKRDSATIRITNPQPGFRYLWFTEDHPSHVSRFPQGIYSGRLTGEGGVEFKAEAYVVPNKYGFRIGEKGSANDYGYWIHLMIYKNGPLQKPATWRISSKSAGLFPTELVVDTGGRPGEDRWVGRVADGTMQLTVNGVENGRLLLDYSSYRNDVDSPIHSGISFSSDVSGNYYIASQKISTGAISLNRIGVSLHVDGTLSTVEPINPDKITSAGILMWLDASDLDADGKNDPLLPRKAVFGWKSRAGGAGFGENNFVNFQPNSQNGLGTCSWQYIWIQSLEKEVNHFQTIMMVRKEHSLSDVGSAPWRGLTDLIGVGQFGKQLMSPGVSDAIREGAVFLNGERVDPFKAAMPTGFYIVTYEFSRPVDSALKRSDGYWEGSLAECLIFDGKLSAAERRGIEAQLAAKWLFAGTSPGK